MSANRLGGYALCVSALINVVQSVWYTAGGDDIVPVKVVGLVGAILLILGLASCLPAIQRTQPRARRAGYLGLALMEAAALVSLALNLYFMAGGPTADLTSVASGASALLGLAGVLLVGSLTIRTAVFPAWAGLLLIAGGILNFVSGLIAPETLASALGLISVLLVSSALMGFGLYIIRKPGSIKAPSVQEPNEIANVVS